MRRSELVTVRRGHDVIARGLQTFLEQTDFLLGVVHQHDAQHPAECSR